MRAGALALLGVTPLAGVAAADQAHRPEGAPATCRHQSSFDFKRSASDLVVGPLVLAGARRYSSPGAVATLGGQKYPAIVLAGHRVTVELSRDARRSSSLLYADDHWGLPGGGRSLADGHRVVEFRACATARSGSSYEGRQATFWSGFVMAAGPRCVSLRVWVDDERAPRRASIALGSRCA